MRRVLILLALLLAPSFAAAQTCTGTAPEVCILQSGVSFAVPSNFTSAGSHLVGIGAGGAGGGGRYDEQPRRRRWGWWRIMRHHGTGKRSSERYAHGVGGDDGSNHRQERCQHDGDFRWRWRGGIRPHGRFGLDGDDMHIRHQQCRWGRGNNP